MQLLHFYSQPCVHLLLSGLFLPGRIILLGRAPHTPPFIPNITFNTLDWFLISSLLIEEYTVVPSTYLPAELVGSAESAPRAGAPILHDFNFGSSGLPSSEEVLPNLVRQGPIWCHCPSAQNLPKTFLGFCSALLRFYPLSLTINIDGLNFPQLYREYNHLAQAMQRVSLSLDKTEMI